MILSIIIPVFNEEKTIKLLLGKVNKLTLPSQLKKEIIIINDGSTDQTAKILKKIKQPNIRVIDHKKNQGKGAAVKTGFKAARGEILVIQDADLEYNPEDLKRLIGPILSGQAMVIYGTRLKNFPLKLWGRDRTPIPSHYLGNKFLTTLTNILYLAHLSDMETCYKLFKKEVLQDLNFKSKRFDIEPELTAKVLKKGYKIYELPIKVKPRSFQEGKKIKWTDGLFAIWALIKFRFID